MVWPGNVSGGGETTREAVRNASMGAILQHIVLHPGCTVAEISRETGVSKSEVSRYIRYKKIEFRGEDFIMNLRKYNYKYYIRLISEAEYIKRNGESGFLINTSKRLIFDRYAFMMWYNISIDLRGRIYAFSFWDDPIELARSLGTGHQHNVTPMPKTDNEGD